MRNLCSESFHWFSCLQSHDIKMFYSFFNTCYLIAEQQPGYTFIARMKTPFGKKRKKKKLPGPVIDGIVVERLERDANESPPAHPACVKHA